MKKFLPVHEPFWHRKSSTITPRVTLEFVCNHWGHAILNSNEMMKNELGKK